MLGIQCSINGYNFQQTLCDTGSGVNIMAAVTYQLLFGTMPLKPTYIQLQMADQTFRKVEDSKQVRTRRRRHNRNQRRQIIKDGWTDYEGYVIRSEDIQLEQNYSEETIAPSQVCREKIVIHEEQAPPEPPTTPSSESQDD